uniref:Uncharacterized protein n=1 Tax=Cannabis sativa TaxID=3483 RepID=A0A803QL57_CANSA
MGKQAEENDNKMGKSDDKVATDIEEEARRDYIKIDVDPLADELENMIADTVSMLPKKDVEIFSKEKIIENWIDNEETAVFLNRIVNDTSVDRFYYFDLVNERSILSFGGVAGVEFWDWFGQMLLYISFCRWLRRTCHGSLGYLAGMHVIMRWFGGTRLPRLLRLFYWQRVVFNQWRNAQQRRLGSLFVSMVSDIRLEHWVKPVVDTIKVNVDGANLF